MKRMKKLLTGLLTLAMTLSMMTMTAFAAEGSGTKMPTIDFGGNKKGSITIHKYEYNGSEIARALPRHRLTGPFRNSQLLRWQNP